jgi:hypothetical protein
VVARDPAQNAHTSVTKMSAARNTLRWMMGEEQITHLGMDYYLDE